jgi:hypothetical protein
MARAEQRLAAARQVRAGLAADGPFSLFPRESAKNPVLFAAVGLQPIFLDRFL